MAQNVENLGKYTFIKYDSIPMISTNDRDYYSALTPTYPIHPVWTATWKIPYEKISNTKCFKMGGGMIEQCINYKVLIDGDTVLIDSHEKFREIFAPVDNEQEAIAFAYIFTDSEPMYNLDFLYKQCEQELLQTANREYNRLQMELYQKRINDELTDIPELRMEWLVDLENYWYIHQPIISSSYVKKVEDGYELLLYHYVVFGCSHPYMERLIKVYFDGNVEILEQRAAFSKASENGFCLD